MVNSKIFGVLNLIERQCVKYQGKGFVASSIEQEVNLVRKFIYNPIDIVRDSSFVKAVQNAFIFFPLDLFRNSFGWLLLSSNNKRLKEAGLFTLTVNTPGRRREKFLLNLDRVDYRLDASGMMQAGIRMASDVRDLNRGPLVIGRAWNDSYRKKIIAPQAVASPEDYRFTTHETIRRMFVEGCDWKETPEYAACREEIRLGLKPLGLKNQKDLDDRGPSLIALYQSIATDGVKRSEVVGSPSWDEVHFYIDDKGGVCVGRHGNHRLAIARLLGIRWVPAILGGVHVDWANKIPPPRRNIRKECLSYLYELGVIEPFKF